MRKFTIHRSAKLLIGLLLTLPTCIGYSFIKQEPKDIFLASRSKKKLDPAIKEAFEELYPHHDQDDISYYNMRNVAEDREFLPFLYKHKKAYWRFAYYIVGEELGLPRRYQESPNIFEFIKKRIEYKNRCGKPHKSVIELLDIIQKELYEKALGNQSKAKLVAYFADLFHQSEQVPDLETKKNLKQAIAKYAVSCKDLLEDLGKGGGVGTADFLGYRLHAIGTDWLQSFHEKDLNTLVDNLKLIIHYVWLHAPADDCSRFFTILYDFTYPKEIFSFIASLPMDDEEISKCIADIKQSWKTDSKVLAQPRNLVALAKRKAETTTSQKQSEVALLVKAIEERYAQEVEKFLKGSGRINKNDPVLVHTFALSCIGSRQVEIYRKKLLQKLWDSMAAIMKRNLPAASASSSSLEWANSAKRMLDNDDIDGLLIRAMEFSIEKDEMLVNFILTIICQELTMKMVRLMSVYYHEDPHKQDLEIENMISEMKTKVIDGLLKVLFENTTKKERKQALEKLQPVLATYFFNIPGSLEKQSQKTNKSQKTNNYLIHSLIAISIVCLLFVFILFLYRKKKKRQNMTRR